MISHHFHMKTKTEKMLIVRGNHKAACGKTQSSRAPDAPVSVGRKIHGSTPGHTCTQVSHGTSLERRPTYTILVKKIILLLILAIAGMIVFSTCLTCMTSTHPFAKLARWVVLLNPSFGARIPPRVSYL